MTEIERWRRKPVPPYPYLMHVARYQPPLDRLAFERLTEVTRIRGNLADEYAQVSEVTFRNGKRVLLVYYWRYSPDSAGEAAYVTVEPGNYLCFKEDTDTLTEYSEADLNRWYDRLAEDEQPAGETGGGET